MVNGHACTPIQSRPGGRKDRCDEISSSRWGFPWRPDLPRFSPLGQGHPSRTLSHNRCAFTLLLEKSSIFLLPFFTGGELLEMETFFLKGRWWWWNVWKELSTMIFTSATKQIWGSFYPILLLCQSNSRRSFNSPSLSPLRFLPRCLFNGGAKERKVGKYYLRLANDAVKQLFADYQRPIFVHPHFTNLLLRHFFAVSNFETAVSWKQLGEREEEIIKYEWNGWRARYLGSHFLSFFLIKVFSALINGENWRKYKEAKYSRSFPSRKISNSRPISRFRAYWRRKYGG